MRRWHEPYSQIVPVSLKRIWFCDKDRSLASIKLSPPSHRTFPLALMVPPTFFTIRISRRSTLDDVRVTRTFPEIRRMHKIGRIPPILETAFGWEKKHDWSALCSSSATINDTRQLSRKTNSAVGCTENLRCDWRERPTFERPQKLCIGAG